MGEPLYLHSTLLARGELQAADGVPVALIPYRNVRMAVVFRSKTTPYNARIAVITTTPRNHLIGSPVFTPLASGEPTLEQPDGGERVWGGTWSPDGRLLVVYGIAQRASDGKLDAAVWLLAQNGWIDDDHAHGTTSESTPLVLRVCPRDLLASDAQWRASGASKRAAHAICSAFFPAKSPSRCFFVTQDGWVLKMEIQAASLLVAARSNGPIKSDPASFVKLNTVMRITNWHAGVTAVAYEPNSSTLVVSGGLKNPSAELRAQAASSLSAWSVTTDDPFLELLDYTMVMGASRGLDGTEDAQEHDVGADSNGIMKKMRHSFLNPLKMLHGDDDDDGSTLAGSISHLAISPDGILLSIVNQDGYVRVRQIDTCADMVPWHFVQDDISSSGSPVTATTWCSPSTLGFVTSDHRIVFGSLASIDLNEAVDTGDSEDTGPSLQVILQKVTGDEVYPDPGRVMRWLHSWAGVFEDESMRVTPVVFQDLSIFRSSASSSWQLSIAKTVPKAQLIQMLIDDAEYSRALDMIETSEVDGDLVDSIDHFRRQIWSKYRAAVAIETIVPGIDVLDTGVSFHKIDYERALTCLNSIKHDKFWVANECLHVIVSGSLLEMKELLATGLRALIDIQAGEQTERDHTRDRSTLLRYLYRLDTLNELIIAELDDDERRVLADEQCFDGSVFATFRDAPIVDVAHGFAKEGRLDALTVLFRRNGFNLVPRRTQILDQLPATTPPQLYAHLLPAVGPHSHDEWHFYSLTPRGPSDYAVSEVQLLLENRTHDLSADEASSFELCARKDPNERRDEYALWFTHRMVELDSMFGQLGNAFELGRCGRVGLLGGVDLSENDDERQAMNVVSSTPFEDFLQHSDRLFKCVHSLHIPGCFEVSLEDWSLLSLHDQIMAVVIEECDDSQSTMEELLHRLKVIFLEHRRHEFALDGLVSWLCQLLLSKRGGSSRRSSSQMLELCAQLIHQSNPANTKDLRWIQDDARLLRTAIDVIYSASAPESTVLDVNVEENVNPRQAHQQFVETLWLIFQSLPERKPNDPPELAQLQVEVDGIEDLLITVDVLVNYGILTSPAEIRENISSEDAKDSKPSDESAYAMGLVDRMCSFGLSNNIPWTSIWQDALKVKSHVFGERVTQESMLSLLLRQILALYHGPHGEYAKECLEDAHELIANWITANIAALPTAMDILLLAIKDRTNHGKDEEASHIVVMAQSILGLPVVAETEEARPVIDKFQTIMAQEHNYMKVRELLELLTYGSVKVSRAALRDLRSGNDRFDLIISIFTSNPSNYKMSVKAEAWLRQDLNLPPDTAIDVVLDGVMHLAKLLGVDSSHKVRIELKAAYSALYCLDYDTAHRLASKIVPEWSPTRVGSTAALYDDDGEQAETTTLLLSLILDLLSSSSFRSWTKKIELSKLLLREDVPTLWGHPVADLIFECARKVEATYALAAELGLSESDLEERRDQDHRLKLSAEDALLKELELVVDLLYEEGGQKGEDDRDFVLRLLQKGFQLFMLIQTHVRTPLAPPSPTARARARSSSQVDEDVKLQWTIRVLSQMSVIAFRVAYKRVVENEGEWLQAMEDGFAYLMLLSGFSHSGDDVERVWREDIVSIFSRSSNDNEDTSVRVKDEAFIRKFGQFFEFLAASVSIRPGSTGVESLREVMHDIKHSSAIVKKVLFTHSERAADDFDEDVCDVELASCSTTKAMYIALAKECQELLHSQEKFKELEAVSSFVNDDVDQERFSGDADYRLHIIRRMSIRREQLTVAKEFALKYGIDEYECVLAYIWHAFFPDEATTDSITRQDQLEQAFRGTDDAGGDDFLEQALQRPLLFGEFLLRPTTGVFESLPGTDHVGILLVLRMVLECSKRTVQNPEVNSREGATHLPLSKNSSDRVTLLFMCLKRLKEISDAAGSPDFKLICSATTAHDLLYGSSEMDQSRVVAMSAIAPFLTSKNIKMLTKVLQKLHQMSPSAIVMVYLNDMLSKIWHEHETRGNAPNADLAAYAYESSMPFLSVLSIDHLMIFYARFVLSDASEDVSSQFYGQQLTVMPRFGRHLSTEKRLEIVSENIGLFHSRLDVLKASSVPEDVMEQRTLQLRLLEDHVVEAAFWCVVDKASQSNLFEVDPSTWLEEWKRRVGEWFRLDNSSKIQQEDQILNALVVFCERTKSLDLASLLVEMALGLTSPPEFAARALQDIYRKGVSDVIQKALTRDGSESLADEVVANWASRLVPSSTDEISHTALLELAQYVASVEPHNSTTPSTDGAMDGTYRDLIIQLEGVSSPLVRGIASKRKEKMSSSGDEGSSIRAAVFAQWKAVISQYEEQENWMTSAMLSHVLTDNRIGSIEDRQYDFGLRVKAVCEWLRIHHHESSWDHLFALPTADLYTNFESQVFDHILTIIESCRSQGAVQSAQQVCISLANILRWFEELRGMYQASDATEEWRVEKERAVLIRLGETANASTNENGSADTTVDNRLWKRLLTHGSWDERLMQWYTFTAYHKIIEAKSVEEYAITHGDAHPALSIMLLLVCPFEELRTQHREHILTTSRLQLLSHAIPQSTKVRLLELLLLRFDIQTLLHVEGLETVLLAFYTEQNHSIVWRKSLSWTSSVEYYICQLVELHEYAAASRLVCSMWNVHPMLWDLENARLMLGNYLASLAKARSTSTKPVPLQEAVERARLHAYQHYQQQLI